MGDDRRTGTWVTYVDDAPSAIQVRRCRLTVEAGPSAGASVEVESELIRVGARGECELTLEDPRVSGHHFEICLDEGGFLLRDLDSTNGTFVDDLRIREAYLTPGLSIKAGQSTIRFEPLSSTKPVELAGEQNFGDIVGKSPVMRALFARLKKVAPTEASVLITGETGVGKELVAQAIHEASPRVDAPFVVVDCGSIPANLISSHLFGHEKGAFTGAHTSYAGAFERASGGTIFLDELGELPVDLQPTLLGVLERKQVRRVGGRDSIPVDVRVVAATNRNLAREMNQGRFRDDLYYRLAVVVVQVPSLRERPEDIPLLVEHFLRGLPGGEKVRLKPKTLENLARHEYRGNVRELRNLIERAVVLSDETGIFSSGPQSPSEAASGPLPGAALAASVDTSVPYKRAKGALLSEFERRFFTKLIQEHDGLGAGAARATGLDRMTVHKMLQRHNIPTR